jgi:CopG family nickel-responsive transcriptional regulator
MLQARLRVGCETMHKIKRAGVTFPPDLLKDLDEIVKTMGYGNRSKAVQDAVRMFVAERKSLQDETEDQAGFIIMLYDHEARGLESALTHVQHHFAHVICSSMHIHLSETDCLEAIAVKGKATEVRKLRDQLATRRGVKLFKVMVFAL